MPCSTLTLPDSLLGGSTPGLQSLYLVDIAALGLLKLLLSATGLIHLHLQNIPDSWDISPYMMADCLSSLTRLEDFGISFSSHPLFELESLHPPPLSRTILPKLNSLSFNKGPHEYLEVLFTWIGAPLHNDISISFFNLAIFDISQMSLFNGLEELIQTPDRAYMYFKCSLLNVDLSSPQGTTCDTSLLVSFVCGDMAWQILALNQVRSWFSPPLGCRFSRPYICELPLWTSDMENV